VHHPVTNRNGDEIASAVTNLDLHDISRAACTYGVKRFYVVTPLADQRELAKKVAAHWTEGPGGSYNPDRRRAFSLLRVRESLDQVLAEVQKREGVRPRTAATDARPSPGAVTFGEFRQELAAGRPWVLILGTAWGLTRQAMARADCVLAPLTGPTGYNHLSVRSAAAIMLDRLLGG